MDDACNYRLSVEATHDVKRIYRYGYEMFGEHQADQYYQSLFEMFEKIGKNPTYYPLVDHIRKGYRRCSALSDAIYFRAADDGKVEIMRIIGNQDLRDH